jgi:hypothetical protein
MKKIKLILFSAVISSFFFTSCNELDSDTLEGSDLTDGGNSTLIVGWANATVTESYFSDIGILDNSYPVDVLGGSDGSPTTSNIDLTITVDASTTATAGNEYVLNTTSVTIPAGSSFAGVPVGINTGGFNPTQPTKLVLNVAVSVNGVVVSDAAKQMTINFVGCQSTLADFTYAVTITRDDGAETNFTEGLTMESVNNFLTHSVGLWSPPLNPGHGVRFGDICGSLSMETQELADMYSNAVTPVGGATVDANGNFTLKYIISFGSGDRTYTAEYTRQ